MWRKKSVQVAFLFLYHLWSLHVVPFRVRPRDNKQRRTNCSQTAQRCVLFLTTHVEVVRVQKSLFCCCCCCCCCFLLLLFSFLFFFFVFPHCVWSLTTCLVQSQTSWDCSCRTSFQDTWKDGRFRFKQQANTRPDVFNSGAELMRPWVGFLSAFSGAAVQTRGSVAISNLKSSFSTRCIISDLASGLPQFCIVAAFCLNGISPFRSCRH